MITPILLFRESEEVAELYEKLEIELLKSMALHLKSKPNEEFEEWQVRMLKEVYGLEDDAIKLFRELAVNSESEIAKLIADNANDIELETDEALKVKAKPSKTIDLVVEGLVNQANGDLRNYIQESLITTNFKDSVLARQYKQVVKDITLLHTTGALTLDDAIERTVKDLAKKGIKSGFVDKGGRYWSIERYSKAVLKTTLQNTYNEVRTTRMRELKRYTVLVSSHPKSREACAYCQGKVVDIRTELEATDGYPSIYQFGYGEPSGHRGVNCTHIWLPFNPEIHTNNMPHYDAEEAIRNEEIEQKRKYLARKIRATKKELSALEVLGCDVEPLERKLRRQERVMQAYCKDNGIRRKKRLEKIIEV